MSYWEEPSPQNDYLAPHIIRLLHSYRMLLGRDLIDPTPPELETREREALPLW